MLTGKHHLQRKYKHTQKVQHRNFLNSRTKTIFFLEVTMQPVIRTRIYVLHKITIALKFMSYINSDLLIPARKLETPGHNIQRGINGLEAGS